MPGMQPANASEVSVCLVYNQLKPVKWVYDLVLQTYASEVSICPSTQPAYTSEMSVCLVNNQLIGIKWVYAWYATSLCQ